MEWTQIQHPSHLNGYLNPDTSRGTPKTLLTEVTLPTGHALFLPAPDLRRSVVDTTQDTSAPLLSVPRPFIPAPFFHPVRFWFQPNDTSAGTPKGLLPESLPAGRAFFVPVPDQNRTVIDTSCGTAVVAQVAPSPFVPAPQLAPIRFWFQPADSSAGIPKVLFNDATSPNFNYQHTAPVWRIQVNDTSASSPVGLLTAFVPPPAVVSEWIIRARRRSRR